MKTLNKMTRQEANRAIVAQLSRYVEYEPDWRFFQILQNLKIDPNDGVDRFYEESVETFDRMIKN